MKVKRSLAAVTAVLSVGLISPSVVVASASSSRVPEKGIAIILADDAPLSGLTPTQLVAQAKKTFRYVATSLHANAISINFPFYMDAVDAQELHGGPGTPTVTQLNSLTKVAQSFGLMVQYRPFLSEANFATPGFEAAWRGVISPPDPVKWLADYQQFLRPYLILAQKNRITSFSIAVELNSLLGQLGAWRSVVHFAQTLYRGPLIYSGTSIYNAIAKTEFGWDDYTPVSSISYKGVPVLINENSSAQQVSIGFSDNLRRSVFPSAMAATRLEEVGISAITGAYQFPWAYYLQGPTNRTIQANWFSAACDAFFNFHMRGLYFWGLELEFFQPGSVASDAFQWYGTAGADAIASCYSRTS